MTTKTSRQVPGASGGDGCAVAPARSALTDEIIEAFLDAVAGETSIPSEVTMKLRETFGASTLRQADVDRVFETPAEDH